MSEAGSTMASRWLANLPAAVQRQVALATDANELATPPAPRPVAPRVVSEPAEVRPVHTRPPPRTFGTGDREARKQRERALTRTDAEHKRALSAVPKTLQNFSITLAEKAILNEEAEKRNVPLVEIFRLGLWAVRDGKAD